MSTATFAAPGVATAGSDDPHAPLVVLLHGRGAHEDTIIDLARALPPGPAYAAVRAPIAEGGGFAWFANRGIGRPVAESLRATMDWFREWLDTVAPPGRPVVLIGFSGGAAFAGGLLLDDPARFAGAAVLYGTLPFDAGVPTTPARLAGTPVFVAQGTEDTVIPRELLDRTWRYLNTESGAPCTARRDLVGHGIAAVALAHLGGWLGERLAFVAAPPVLPSDPGGWVGPAAGERLPRRRGSRPEVSTTIPQQQRGDNAPPALQEALFARMTDLPGVVTGPSTISVPGARGLFLTMPPHSADAAFLVPESREFAHLHPEYDGSLHLSLSPALAAEAITAGWAVAHPLAGVRLTPGMVMVYGPRDERELDVVTTIVTTSHAWVSGASDRPNESVA